jgi:hypothetical protein
MNPNVDAILRRLPQLSRPGCWLTSGCLAQTLWNLKAGRNPDAGIDDYDLLYHDSDVSWDAEDAMIREADALFGDLPIRVEIRNQARVPHWYTRKFGLTYPRLQRAHRALHYYPSRSTALAITVDREGHLACYAPFGVADLWNGIVRPNRALDIPQVYRSKAQRWLSEWPQLEVWEWGDMPATLPSSR